MEDLQYLSSLKALEELVPASGKDLAEKTEKALDELQKPGEDTETAMDDRQKFTLQRSEQMSAEDYQRFVSSRTVGLLYKGRKALCRWLGASKEIAQDRTLLEAVALVAKSAMRRVVEDAIRKRSPKGVLHIITAPLKPEELAPFMEGELNSLKSKLEQVIILHANYHDSSQRARTGSRSTRRTS